MMDELNNILINVDRALTEPEIHAMIDIDFNMSVQDFSNSLLKTMNCNKNNHNWVPIANSTDVICSICGIKAMISVNYL